MRVRLALGGPEGERWLHLPDLARPRDWPAAFDPAQAGMLLDLVADSPTGSLDHPGEVPVAGATTLGGILALVAEELGAEARIRLLRLRAGSLVLHGEDGLGLRLEAGDDAAFAPALARLTAVPASRWSAILAALRAEAWTERTIEVEVDGRGARTWCDGALVVLAGGEG